MPDPSALFTGRHDSAQFDASAALLGDSPETRALRAMIARVARTQATVLVTGETGTGKEVVARCLHRASAFAEAPFVAVNCAAIPVALLESELFGHEKGAFTGAVAARAGRLEAVRGGTLFLDEIGDMPLELQAKLLRVLQERSFERLGGQRSLPLDCRVVAATHTDLPAALAAGRFRADLYYRLNVVPLHVAPLRLRPGDITTIARHALSRAQMRYSARLRLEHDAVAVLQTHDWPGNVRELMNFVERLVILCGEEVLGARQLQWHLARHVEHMSSHEDARDAAALPAAAGALPAEGIDLKAALAGVEAQLIRTALAASGGVVARAAELLHIPRTTLIEKLHRLRDVRRTVCEDEDEHTPREVHYVGAGRIHAVGDPGYGTRVGAQGFDSFRIHRWRPPALSPG
jgi:sigma-54 specific flagellar transcriptional regulator A